MRWLFVFLLLLPLAYADTSSTFWQYKGDTWEYDGILYSIEGNDPDRVLLGIDGQLLVLGLYDCAERGNAEYCYIDSGFPDDDSHIKYEAGEQLFAYNIEIRSYAPEISLSRDIDEREPGLDEKATVTVDIKNTGDFAIYNLVYEEDIPAGLTLRSGPRKGLRQVYFTEKLLPRDQTLKFTYVVSPDTYGEYELSPTFTYEFAEKEENISVGGITIDVETPVDVIREAPTTSNLEEEETYTINVTNDASQDLTVTVELTLPEGLRVMDPGEFIARDGMYVVETILEENLKESYEVTFASTREGEFTIHADVTTVMAGIEATQTYDDVLTVKSDKLSPSITVSPSRDSYFPETSLTVSALLENVNDELSFEDIKGKLEGGGTLFKTVPFSHDSISPSKTKTEAKTTFLTPQVTEETTFTIEMSGSYKTKGGSRFTFETEKTITVEPFKNIVEVTRTVTPIQPSPGENVTIAITAKNIFDTYITVDAHEKFPDDIKKVAGLSFASTSLERDASEELYTYKIAIPPDYTEDRFTLTTSVLTKGESIPETFETVVELAGAAPVEEVVEAAPDEEVVEQAPEEEEERGFFGSIWHFFKGLFD
ncbi:MAG: hypothetical protein OXR66_00565 [Candidatus Woesearchaeota archaeon]|nr:hypothetical protein [Candidatus Woesearchaeota archaeon]